MGLRASAVSVAALLGGCALLSDLDGLSTAEPTDPPDATPTDAPPADAREDPSPEATPASCPESALFCDGFEAGDLSRWSSVYTTAGGTASASSLRSHGGMWSLHAVSQGGSTNAGAQARVRLGAPRSSGVLVVRTWMFMSAQMANNTTILEMSATNGDDMNVKIDGAGVIYVDTDTAGSGASKIGSAVAPIGKWFCLEWQATIAATGRQKLLLDGATALDVGENTETPAGYEFVRVGLNSSTSTMTQEIWIDDVAVATDPIGCP